MVKTMAKVNARAIEHDAQRASRERKVALDAASRLHAQLLQRNIAHGGAQYIGHAGRSGKRQSRSSGSVAGTEQVAVLQRLLQQHTALTI